MPASKSLFLHLRRLIFPGAFPGSLLPAALGLGGSLCAAFAIASRLSIYLRLGRLPRIALLAAAAVLAWPLLSRAVHAAWGALARERAIAARVWVLGLAAAGLALWLIAPVPTLLPQLQHRLEIHSNASGPVKISEIRDPRGRPAATRDLKVRTEGIVRAPHGLFFPADIPAQADYEFSSAGGSQVSLTFKKQPEGGQALLYLDGVETRVDLRGQAEQPLQVSLPITHRSPWELVSAAADFAALLIVFPGLVFSLARLLGRGAQRWETTQGVFTRLGLRPLNYQAWFLAVLTVFLLLPLYQFPGLASFEKGFWLHRGMASLYNQFRVSVLGDRVRPTGLVGRQQ